MSKLRSVSTGTWSDPWYEELEPHQKLIFLYLITNEKTNMLGIYEASVKKISFETGVKKDDITKCLDQFEIDGKIKYQNNFIILVNFLKHQNFNTNMKKGAIKVYDSLPKDLKVSGLILDDSNPIESFESLSNHYGTVSKRESNTNTNIKEKEKPKENNNIVERENKFRLQSKEFNQYDSKMIDEFCDYWTEQTPSGKKMLYETNRTFDIKRRLQRWNKNNFNKFNNGKPTVNNSKPTTAEVYQLDYEQNSDRDREILLAQLKQRKIEREQSGN